MSQDDADDIAVEFANASRSFRKNNEKVITRTVDTERTKTRLRPPPPCLRQASSTGAGTTCLLTTRRRSRRLPYNARLFPSRWRKARGEEASRKSEARVVW